MAQLRQAHQQAEQAGWEVTDDAALFERLGWPVQVLEASSATSRSPPPWIWSWPLPCSEHAEGAAAAIKPHGSPQRQRRIGLTMAKGQFPHHGNAQIKAAFAQHLLKAEARTRVILGRFTALKAAKAKARQLLQGATRVASGSAGDQCDRGFANVFQQQHPAGQLGAVLGAQ